MALPNPYSEPVQFWGYARRRQRHGRSILPAPFDHRIPDERHVEMLHLRIVEGLTLREIGERSGLSGEAVRRALAHYFGLTGTPPAADARAARHTPNAPAGPTRPGLDPGVIAFSQRVRALRIDRGMTQNKLAQHTGLHLTEISKLDRALTDPRLSTVLRLARALDVNPGVLLEDLDTAGGPGMMSEHENA